jgi:antitoxin (DNA-binding transcriptional repressor) of toxin-antitoxin stability system
MLTVAKGVLKAKMLEYFRQVEQTGEELIVTDHRKPVLKITSIAPPKANVDEVFSDLKGKAVYHENINTPTMDEWGEV